MTRSQAKARVARDLGAFITASRATSQCCSEEEHAEEILRTLDDALVFDQEIGAMKAHVTASTSFLGE